MSKRNDSMNVAAAEQRAAGEWSVGDELRADTSTNDRVREAVSTMFDGEATELELRRLLGSEPAGLVNDAWRDYQLQRDALQGVDIRFAGLDISARVQAAIAADLAPAAQAAGGARWWRPLASMAVAASVATVVVIGARGFSPAGGFGADRGANLVAQTATNNMNRVHASLGNVSAGVQPFGPLAAGNGLPGTVFPRNEVVGNGFPAVQTVAFDADQAAQQQRLQRYLLRHSERAALNNQGVISFAKVSRLSEE